MMALSGSNKIPSINTNELISKELELVLFYTSLFKKRRGKGGQRTAKTIAADSHEVPVGREPIF